MPIYDFVCTVCGDTQSAYMSIEAITDHVNHPWCCEVRMGRRYRVALAKTSKGKYQYDEMNLGDTPVRINDRHQLDRELKKRGLYQRTVDSEKRYKARNRRDLGSDTQRRQKKERAADIASDKKRREAKS